MYSEKSTNGRARLGEVLLLDAAWSDALIDFRGTVLLPFLILPHGLCRVLAPTIHVMLWLRYGSRLTCPTLLHVSPIIANLDLEIIPIRRTSCLAFEALHHTRDAPER